MHSIRKNLKDIADHLQRPSTTFKPELRSIIDDRGNTIGWNAIYHRLCAEGTTPAEAMVNFDKIWFLGTT